MKYLYLTVAVAAFFAQTATAKPHHRIRATNLPTWKHPSKLPNGKHHIHTHHHKKTAGRRTSVSMEDAQVMVALLAARGGHHTHMSVKGGKMTRLSLTPHGTRSSKFVKGKRVLNKKRGFVSFDPESDTTPVSAAGEIMIRFTFEMGPFRITFYFPVSAVASSAVQQGPAQDDSNVPDPESDDSGSDMVRAEPAPGRLPGLLSGAVLELTPWQRRSRI